MMHIEAFFDKDTAAFSYVLVDTHTKQCAIIDSVLNYDPNNGQISHHGADAIIQYVQSNQLTVQWHLETHIHADHLTASHYLKSRLGGQIAISQAVQSVLAYWVPLFNTAHDTPIDGSQFDRLWCDGDLFLIGDLSVRCMATPGHTEACMAYLVEDVAFVGDVMFMPDVGTARTDFPGASATQLYGSIQRLFALPDQTRLFTAHDYPPSGIAPRHSCTVAEQKASNIMIHDGIDEATFVAARHTKDQGKAVPRLLLPSIQVNARAGQLGQAEANGIQYIKIPINTIA